MSLAVETIGAGATLQDGGRPGYRRYGVPVGGAFDRESLALGNALVGNPPAAPAIEFTVVGGRFRAVGHHRVAVAGADLDLTVNGTVASVRTPLELKPGDVLRLGTMRGGARAYLCVAGGFEAELILGSLSGAPVSKDESLSVGPHIDLENAPEVLERARSAPSSLSSRPLHIVPGPQRAAFPSGDLASRTYEVSAQCNRVGIRLSGPPLDVPDEAPSEPMCVGAVQITRDGLPVLIGPDGPTIGGYPKPACVIEADWNRMAQLVPGDTVAFQWI